MDNRISYLVTLFVFGLLSAACQRLDHVSGRIWHDVDADGVKTADESWLAGVQVDLYELEGDQPASISSVQTDEDGFYQFDTSQVTDVSGLEVKVTAPQGMAFTIKTPNREGALGSDVDATTGQSGLLLDVVDGTEAVVNVGLIGIIPGRTADPSSDAVDCERSLSLTRQALPAHADIIEVSWAQFDADMVFTLRFATESFPSAMAGMDEGDFIGMGIEFLDPRGRLMRDPNTGWLPDRLGNLSLNIIRDPATNTFFGARYEVQDNAWRQIPGIVYPVDIDANAFTLAVPVGDLPAGARGFVAAILYDASAGEIFCDVAAVDEDVLREALSPDPEAFLLGTLFDVTTDRAPITNLPYQLIGPHE